MGLALTSVADQSVRRLRKCLLVERNTLITIAINGS